jgi:hypothetical protein
LGRICNEWLDYNVSLVDKTVVCARTARALRLKKRAERGIKNVASALALRSFARPAWFHPADHFRPCSTVRSLL